MRNNSFIVHDDEERTDYRVEEIPALTIEEVEAIRGLLPYIDDLLALLTPTTDEDIIDDEEIKQTTDEDVDEEEEVIDTDEMTDDACSQPVAHKVNDSMKSSVGTLTKAHVIDDSLEINETDEGWKKRYGGKN